MKLSRMIAPKSLLLAVFAFPGLLMPAFAQQEVDPTWYDPWAAAPKTAHPLQTKTGHRAKPEQRKPSRKLRLADTGSKENQPTQVRTQALHRTQQASLPVAVN